MPVVDLDVDFIRSRHADAVHTMIRQHLRAGQTGVDVGAARGETVATMRACVGPSGTVIAVEPRDSDVAGADVVHRVAASHAAGTTPLFLPSIVTGASIFRGAIFDHYQNPVVQQVPTARLDDLVEHADLVKLDVQGAEVNVLKGALRLLTTCPVWILEVWPYGLHCAHHSVEDVWLMLWSAGLIPYDIDGAAVTPSRIGQWLMRIRAPIKHTNWVCVRG